MLKKTKLIAINCGGLLGGTLLASFAFAQSEFDLRRGGGQCRRRRRRRRWHWNGSRGWGARCQPVDPLRPLEQRPDRTGTGTGTGSSYAATGTNGKKRQKLRISRIA